MNRVYLDHNATTPVRAEARAAMVAAMDVVGNPSSVHAEGRAAKALVERARAQVAALVGCRAAQVIFTSGATEAAALAVAQKGRHGGRFAAVPTEHECLLDWSEVDLLAVHDRDGALQTANILQFADLRNPQASHENNGGLFAVSAANSETGVMMPQRHVPGNAWIKSSSHGTGPCHVVSDVTQMAGKVPVVFGDDTPSYAILSAHKLGGPKGVGALINFTSEDPEAILKGGGQEMGRRSGTENVIGIAGFGAAAEAAKRDVDAGAWDRVAKLRNILEKALEGPEKETIFVGKDAPRLPNTSCMLSPGWKGETQVMQMDLAGFAVSAGSACSSGKVRASKVLLAMGYDETEAACAIRVSLGLGTTEDDVMRFAEAWTRARDKHFARHAAQ